MAFSEANARFGNIPESVIARKFEATDYYIDPEEYNDYMRRELRDLSPDAPLFESDQPRQDTKSKEFLEIRNSGYRTDQFPDHPDLFLGLTGHDPRGYSNTPILTDARVQTESRHKTLKKISDSQSSVSEREKRPWVITSDIRNAHYNQAKRLKIFSASKTARPVGGLVQKDIHAQSMYSDDISIPEISNAELRPCTTLVADLVSMGDISTPDHEIKVAQYCVAPNRGTSAVVNTEAFHQSRLSNIRPASAELKSRTSANVAQSMISVLANKHNIQGQTSAYGIGKESVNHRGRTIAQRANKNSSDTIDVSHDIHKLVMLGQSRIGRQTRTTNTSHSYTDTDVTNIASFMENATRKLRHGQLKPGDTIVSGFTGSKDVFNRRLGKQTNIRGQDWARASTDHGNSMSVAPLAQMHKVGSRLHTESFAGLSTDSDFTKLRKRGQLTSSNDPRHDLSNVKTTANGDTTIDRNIGRMTKFVRDKTMDTIEHSPMSEIS